VYQKHVTEFEKMSNISKTAMQVIKDNFYIPKLGIIDILVDKKDNTTKILFELEDKQKIETVVMEFDYGFSICLSTQVGCNMGCKFCASGLLKKVRDLHEYEIVNQLFVANQYINEKFNKNISNVVVMGIGEPFDNYENLKKALKIFTEPFGLGIGARHITVSTCGLIDKILTYAKDFPQCNLAVSLHAPNDTIRNKIMPVNTVYNINKLIGELRKYSKVVNRRITFEYLLLENVNDSKENANELANLLQGLNCYVNIILYNKISEHDFARSKNASQFAKTLKSNNINVTTRLERGLEIEAACGQLRAKYENN
jgi:23S rRNA (adenine2503-C2)-methyltransferase